MNASNNAGDTPWHWATNMGNTEAAELLERVRGWRPRAASLFQEFNSACRGGCTPYMRSLDLFGGRQQYGATKEKGQVLVQEHVPKVKVSLRPRGQLLAL